ncbi:MAG: S-methyl-5-thioribose-1-phosphate isomerase [Planctomycetia bacterium]|nr:S-methyl-5-thioribose-1-phosphate isomerase [Planctomycetia bacterium]
MPTPTLHWSGDVNGSLVIIDQTRLPGELVEIELTDVDQVWHAIRTLQVRGAPAIGLSAAYGVVLGVRGAAGGSEAELRTRLSEVTVHLAASRPTAVNLAWALKRMQQAADQLAGRTPPEIVAGLLAEAHAIYEEDRAMCRAIGRHGAPLLADNSGVLTHCNAGALVTADYGTALALIFVAHESGKRLHVYVDETRPLLQGARLTAWELVQRGVPATLICDSMAAQVMREGRVQAVVVGADRIAANGDVANKIGTYQVALVAAAHGVPLYVAAPTSTFDLSLTTGDAIPIEQRDRSEITHGFGRATAPEGVGVYNPAFDVTPARLVSAIICERGVIQPVNAERIAAMLAK